MKITGKLIERIESAENITVVTDDSIITNGDPDVIVACMLAGITQLVTECGGNPVQLYRDAAELEERRGKENGSK